MLFSSTKWDKAWQEFRKNKTKTIKEIKKDDFPEKFRRTISNKP